MCEFTNLKCPKAIVICTHYFNRLLQERTIVTTVLGSSSVTTSST